MRDKNEKGENNNSCNDKSHDDAYAEVTANLETATKEFEDSVKQMKQMTNPEESFRIERAKTVDTMKNLLENTSSK